MYNTCETQQGKSQPKMQMLIENTDCAQKQPSIYIIKTQIFQYFNVSYLNFSICNISEKSVFFEQFLMHNVENKPKKTNKSKLP